MKKLTLLSVLVFSVFITVAQYSVSQQVKNFNGFQRTIENNPDSAVHFLRNLASLETNSTDKLLHNSFAQNFLNFSETKLFADSEFLAKIRSANVTLDSARKKFREKKSSAYIILDQIKDDPNAEIRANVYPISKWIEAQENSDNPIRLQKIGQEYLRYLAGTDDFYAERKARYGLLISNIIARQENLKPIGREILKLIYRNLLDHQIVSSENISRDEKEKRAWYRYMFACANFISAQNEDENGVDRSALLKLAYLYSPDTFDKTVTDAYFYDMIFLFGAEKYSFEEDYLATLPSNSERFKVLLAISMNNPSFKAKARALSQDQNKFGELWLTEFNKKFKSAPIFSLIQTDGTRHTLVNTENKWTLLDFWGTWCAPCREEHPDLQKLYESTKNGEIPKLDIITVAKDSRENVDAYLKEFRYSFPVAITDGKIEDRYMVTSWPSKFLISPQGKLVEIPFNVDWVKYVKEYIN